MMNGAATCLTHVLISYNLGEDSIINGNVYKELWYSAYETHGPGQFGGPYDCMSADGQFIAGFLRQEGAVVYFLQHPLEEEQPISSMD